MRCDEFSKHLKTHTHTRILRSWANEWIKLIYFHFTIQAYIVLSTAFLNQLKLLAIYVHIDAYSETFLHWTFYARQLKGNKTEKGNGHADRFVKLHLICQNILLLYYSCSLIAAN